MSPRVKDARAVNSLRAWEREIPAAADRSEAVIGMPSDLSTAEMMVWDGRRSSSES